MHSVDAYRVKAAELFALANDNRYAALKHEFEQLARAYLHLIEQAERFDIAYETPPKEGGDQQPHQK